MTNDSPDWVRQVQLVVTVNNAPVVVDEVTGTPAGGVGRYSGTDVVYQTVVSWTVAAGRVGRLREVAVRSSNYAKTVLKLVIGSTTFFTDKTIGGALTLPFDDVALAAGAVVTLSAKSSDGTSITVDGSITGKEVS
jgi:hypothetical protein